MSRTIALVFLAASVLTPPLAFAITIPTVLVGDAGNANDPATGNRWGGVAYDYRIGTTEVTVAQYTAFLNAVAATDTHVLYDPSMLTDAKVAGISRSGLPGSYTYSVVGPASHPVTYVSWTSAARFVNWLHNGQPTGGQGPETTERGAYPLATGARSPGAIWFIPSESEWYKAAYYQPSAKGGDSDGYWTYPMRTNNVPYSDEPPGATPDNSRVGNFRLDDGLANGYNDGMAVTGSNILSAQNYWTDAGAYTSSPSFYGTFDQGGNVWEWTERIVNPEFTVPLRSIRGGTASEGEITLRSSYSSFELRDAEVYSVGFRVAAIASVPEPSSIALAAVALVGLVALGRRKRA